MDAKKKVVLLWWLTLICMFVWAGITVLLTQQETPWRIVAWWVSLICFTVMYLWGSSTLAAVEQRNRQ